MRNKWAYEDFSSGQFEDLIVILCQSLLGVGVQKFSEGPDGGRDAKFNGVAENFPSTAEPWKGKIVIQAKHTNGYNRNFSESDFFSNSSKSCVIPEEIPRIKRLRNIELLDYYMLFSNRRLAGVADNKIIKYIAEQTDVPKESIFLCGVEQLDLFLRTYPKVPEIANLDPVDAPLLVSPDELSEIIQALVSQQGTIKGTLRYPPPKPRFPFEEKNKLNKMTVEYANQQKKRYLKETGQIREFLAAPENSGLVELYENAVDEFQLKITGQRKDYQTFDHVMDYLVDLLFSRDPILNSNKRLTRVFLFYMYWNCDIGLTEDAS